MPDPQCPSPFGIMVHGLVVKAQSLVRIKPIKKRHTKSKYYAVRVGRGLGIYRTWGECKALVHGYPKASFKSFLVKADAIEWLSGGTQQPKPEKSHLAHVLDKVKVAIRAEKKKTTVNSGHPDDMRGFGDDSHRPPKTMHGELYFELECDCMPWDGCMKCVPIVGARWGVIVDLSIRFSAHQQLEID